MNNGARGILAPRTFLTAARRLGYKKYRHKGGIFFVPRAGFEPAICSLRRNRPRPLDERGDI